MGNANSFVLSSSTDVLVCCGCRTCLVIFLIEADDLQRFLSFCCIYFASFLVVTSSGSSFVVYPRDALCVCLN